LAIRHTYRPSRALGSPREHRRRQGAISADPRAEVTSTRPFWVGAQNQEVGPHRASRALVRAEDGVLRRQVD